jgi:hypothetical protein
VDEDQLREIATEIILSSARDVELHVIRGYLHNADPGFRSADVTARRLAVDAVSELISTATITVEHPEVSR